ncbi:MAG: hypothetical protein JXA14_22165 [Anaerolineae bacterium]|nr:hypothetical protein [Anaerolineae bacterium]
MSKSAYLILHRWPRWISLVLATMLFSAILISANTGTALLAPEDVTFGKAFTPDTIGPGSVSTLQFDITNVSGSAVTNLAFTDVLTPVVKIATPANASTTCTDGILSAPGGGTTISLSGGRLSAGNSCIVTVDVTSSTPGTHTNISGDLTSSAGNHGPATDDLTVATDRPGFSKSFAPDSIPLGSRSTLTFLIDNTANQATASNLTFTDILPFGLLIADPANASHTCGGGGAITAEPGTSVVVLTNNPFDFSYATVGAFSSCAVTVDVTATAAGMLVNTSGELTSVPPQGYTPRSSGKASAVLEVTVGTISLIKSFTDDPVPPGSTATLEFTINNFDRSDAATNIAFSDDLSATLPNLAAIGLPLNNPCGAGSQLTGTNVIALSGGNLAPEGSCTFSVTLQVPTAAATGAYANTTSSITANVGSTRVAGSPALDTLFVQFAPILTKTFLDNPVGAGSTTTLAFTITNSSPTVGIGYIAFTDNLDAVLSGLTVSSLPANGFCGEVSSLSTTFIDAELHLIMRNGDLGPGASCAFAVDLLVPVGAPLGTYTNTTSNITAMLGWEEPVIGRPATDDLVIVPAPRFSKSFVDDPVSPGDAVTLEFTISHDEFAPTDATNIAFTDDLTFLPGMVATGLPTNDVCGAGSQIAGTTSLSFTGGSLAPGTSCTFGVTLQVPGTALPGSYTNQTSNVTATVSGLMVTGNLAQDDLDVAGLSLTKSFTDDPVIPGGTVTLQFTIQNTHPISDATNMTFTDNLTNTLSGLAAVGLPIIAPCGTGSQLTGTNLLDFTGGNLTAGTSCTFSVTLQVPTGATSDTYGNTTSNFLATIDGSTVPLNNASDELVVSDDWLFLTKSFTDDPVAPGDTVTLEFTIENLHATQSVTAVTFTDDLTATLSGLVATGLPANDVCGTGSQISGTDILTFAGGNLMPEASCTFQVTLQVPAGAAFGTYNNETSEITGSIGGLGVRGEPATDDLQVAALAFTKAFDGPTIAGGTVNLEFTIENLESSAGVSDISFSDDLDAVISGLVATSLPPDDFCGAGSRLMGTSLLTLSDGSLGPDESCTFSVTLQVPPTASPGNFVNTTSDLMLAGSPVSDPATDTLTIVPPPSFSKSFAPDSIGLGGSSTLTFAIDNTASVLAASNLDFTDNLPTGVVVANPPNGSTTCTGGTLTAMAGAGVISYTGGTVAAGTSCIVQVNVTGTSVGAHVNTTGDLTSSSGNSGPASDTLTVNPQPGFDKEFAPDPIAAGYISTLSFTIDNTGSTVAASGLDFADNLPAGLVVASPPNGSTTCTGGTLTAVASVISYSGGTVSAGTACTVQVDVTSNTAGDYANTSDNLTSSLGDSGTAMDTLTVEYMDFGDAPDPNYPTLFANTGASHKLGSDVYLGSCVDAEADGQPTPGADGDDVNVGSPIYGSCVRNNDEEGVVFVTPLYSDAQAHILVTANAACTLSAWVDFDGDGDWVDADENLFPGGQLLTAGSTDLYFAVPAGAAVGDTYARFRCTTDGAVSFTGRASDGEVEDYQVTILPPILDLGDAPDPNYPTLLASAGASHKLGSDVYLGSCVDAEANGQPTPGADGDDVNVGSPVFGACIGNDDEDGVIFTSALLADGTTDVEVTANSTCTLSAWIDFNANGNWSDTGESLFPGGQTLLPGSNILSISVPAGAVEGNTYARFRCTTDGAVTSTGEASDGEVEDYRVRIGSALDLGDAPDPTYPTLLASTGASHVLGSDVYLGSCVDAEADGQPTPGADGDDTNASSPVFGTCREGGDEDGVIFTNFLVVGETAGVQVTANAACTLSGWIDFSADGDWLDTGEDLFPGGQALVAGTNDLAFAVPAGAAIGDTYARFRCTTDGAVGFTGEASDGEVEDYQVRIGALDLGDAPDPSYPTLLASAGASHLIGGDVYLGSCVDAEADGQPTPDADGDDVGVGSSVVGTCANDDDEDGVSFTSILIGGQTADVEVTASATCMLSAWIDFNADGDWADAGESLFPGGQTLVAGVNSLNFAVPAGAVRGITYARFRCTTDGAVTFTGEASDGEVEDHRVRIGSALDLGDAPDPSYPTLLGSLGASHMLGSDVYLGSCVDAELDGQPTPGADGDDTNASGLVFGACQAGDDEDGVAFLDLLVGGETVNIEVTANAACTLSGWIDFNADGDWADAGEDLFPGGELLMSGINSLTFAVPIRAKAGDSHARFRCTTDGAVTPTGLASNGEVEDYQVTVWRFTYLPLVMNKYVVAPDLVVENITATSDTITVVIKNVGNASVTDEFWVDAYIDPDTTPTTVNQIWPDLGDEGATWAITAPALPLAPGDVLTLTIGDAYYAPYAPEYSYIDWPLAVSTQVYAQVDSWNGSTTYGAVEEVHEIVGGAYNNVSGPVLVAAEAAALPPLGIEPMLGDLPRISDSLRYRGRKYQWR